MLVELNPPVPLNEFHLGGGGGGDLCGLLILTAMIGRWSPHSLHRWNSRLTHLSYRELANIPKQIVSSVTLISSKQLDRAETFPSTQLFTPRANK